MNFYIKSKRLTKIANINLKKKRHQYHAFYSYYLNPSFKKALSTRIHIPDRRTVGREGVWSYFPEQLRRKNLFSIWPRYANFFHQSFEVKKPRITPALFRNKQYNVKLTLNCSRSLLLNKTGKINRNFTKSPINHLILNVFKHARFNRNDERSYQSYRTKKLLPSLKKKETKKSKRRKLFRFRSARRKSTNLFLSALTL